MKCEIFRKYTHKVSSILSFLKERIIIKIKGKSLKLPTYKIVGLYVSFPITRKVLNLYFFVTGILMVDGSWVWGEMKLVKFILQAKTTSFY